MKVFALDIATQCGWAHNFRKIQSGTISFKHGHFDGAGMCYLRFKAWAKPLVIQSSLVAYEGVMQHGADGVYAQHKYGGFMATLQSLCEDAKVPYFGLGVGEIKKFWTGKGNASKEDMIKAAWKRGHNPKDDNEADALAVLYLAVDLYGDL